MHAHSCASSTPARSILHPDQTKMTLTVRLHHLSARAYDAAIAKLCEELTATETLFPGTELRLIFQFVGSS